MVLADLFLPDMALYFSQKITLHFKKKLSGFFADESRLNFQFDWHMI